MLNYICISQAALTQLIQYYHRFQKILSQHPFKRLPIRSELINIHHVMVEVKKHKTTFWIIEEWTFLAWLVCFPNTDHVIFSRKCSFIHPKIIHSYSRDFWKFESDNSQGYHHMFWDGATNRPRQKRLLAQHLEALLGFVAGQFVFVFRASPNLSRFWSIPTTWS